ncbi:S-layer homology domain-containing protein [Paenibacillus barengoltzii]|uniref:S-layer homology domain-containing protein n=1 Tax=Paenibacillus barengoltzii TaxID=343517 RepID=UPI003879F47F
MKRTKILTVAFLAASLAFGSLASAASFKDVKSSHWAYNTISWATDAGIAKGYPDGTFKPSQAVSEEEFLSMLIRSYKDPADVNPSPYWSYKYYLTAKSLNYPVSGNRTSVITRTWVAEIVAATQGKNYSGTNAIKYMLASGLANGKTGNTVEGYKGNDKLTRAEAVTFIKNVIDKRASDELLPRPTAPSDPNEIGQVPGGNTNPTKPDPEIGKVGDGEDKVLLDRAQKVASAIKGTGYQVKYNTESGGVFIKDPANNKNFFVYTNNGYKDSKYGVVIQYAGLNKNDGTTNLRSDYVNTMVKAMNALGIKADSTFITALKEAEDTGEERIFKSGGKTYYITSINLGAGVISE